MSQDTDKQEGAYTVKVGDQGFVSGHLCEFEMTQQTMETRLKRNVDGSYVLQRRTIFTRMNGGLIRDLWVDLPTVFEEKLTDVQLEKVAKKICLLVGENPEDTVSYTEDGQFSTPIVLYRPRWVSVFFELKREQDMAEIRKQAFQYALL